MNTNKILVVDDEQSIRDMISIMLKSEGYEVTTASNGREAVEKFASSDRFNLVILDIIMPRMNGVEAAKEIRKLSQCPVLFLTAKSADEDKIAAYSSGADDYLQKPFSGVELKLRVKALLKRWSGDACDNTLVFSKDKRTVNCCGRDIQLTEKEYELLHFLYKKRGTAFQISDIYENVWSEKYMKESGNTVMVHILNLRKKLEDDYTKPKYILTVWGKGYCYAEK